MATRKKKDGNGDGVFDVSKPGAPGLTASPTSRPIIVKHQTVQDPMVVPDTTTESTSDEESTPTAPVVKSPSARKIVIQPLDHDDDNEPTPPEQEATAVESEVSEPKPLASETSADEPVEATPVVEEPAEKPIDEPVEEPLEKSIEKPSDAPIPGVPAGANQQEGDVAKAKEHTAAIQQLVASEQYFLPIETTEERRSKRVLIIGGLVIVLLALAWYNVALDANLLSNTFHVPHTSFF